MATKGSRKALTIYQRHKQEWEGCTNCELHEVRKKMVFARGHIPCDVLFVGEAPGLSEDAYGYPFVGPAGHLLDKIIQNANRGYDLRIGFTNLVCCIPKGEDGEKVSQPPYEALMECKPRLEEFIKIASPSIIVCVGKLPAESFEQGMRDSVNIRKDIEVISIDHPAYILRAGSSINLLSRRCEALLSDAFYDLKEKM